MNQKRWKIIKEGEKNSGSVAYWMSRDQRVEDNWPLLFSQELAIEEKSPLAVIFSLVPDFPGANIRHYAFMLKGLKEVEKNLREKNIPFYLLMGEPQKKIPDFTDKYNISALVTGFDPTKIKVNWKKALLRSRRKKYCSLLDSFRKKRIRCLYHNTKDLQSITGIFR